jgi:hypothetical protein
MREVSLKLSELDLIAGTRAAFGGGIALLLGHHLTPRQRRLLGWSLVGVGVLSTVPLLADVLSRARPADGVSGRS